MTPDELRELAEALRSAAKVDPVLWGMATKAAAILERLAVEPIGDEQYARVAHAAYCSCYLLHKGEHYWTGGDWDKLDATYKGYDQTMADAVLDTFRKRVMGEDA